MDSLSLFIDQLSPRCEVFAQVQLKAPWGIAEGAMNGCSFSYIKKGRCLLELDQQAPYWLEQGTLLLLPYGSAHRMMSAPNVVCQQSEQLFFGKSRQQVEAMVIGGDGEPCEVMCGNFAFAPFVHHSDSSLFSGLPEVVMISTKEHPRLIHLLDWLYLENSSVNPGGDLAARGLLDLLLVEVLRSLDSLNITTGWLSALSDRYLAPALAAIQQRPAHDWSVVSLAQQAGLGRSAFASRFKNCLGCSPLQFVRQWRCLLAAQQLLTSNDSVKQLSAQFGFQSSDVFIRNFRNFYGITPQQYRLAAVA